MLLELERYAMKNARSCNLPIAHYFHICSVAFLENKHTCDATIIDANIDLNHNEKVIIVL